MAEKVQDVCKKFLKLSASKEPGDVINGQFKTVRHRSH